MYLIKTIIYSGFVLHGILDDIPQEGESIVIYLPSGEYSESLLKDSIAKEVTSKLDIGSDLSFEEITYDGFSSFPDLEWISEFMTKNNAQAKEYGDYSHSLSINYTSLWTI